VVFKAKYQRITSLQRAVSYFNSYYGCYCKMQYKSKLPSRKKSTKPPAVQNSHEKTCHQAGQCCQLAEISAAEVKKYANTNQIIVFVTFKQISIDFLHKKTNYKCRDFEF
jgi:hypothetical protein